MGMFTFLGKNANSCLPHEYGHSIQMMWWGPLWLFVVAIPSGIRFWYREWYWKYRYPKTHKPLKPYDSAWYEGQATRLGKLANEGRWS